MDFQHFVAEGGGVADRIRARFAWGHPLHHFPHGPLVPMETALRLDDAAPFEYDVFPEGVDDGDDFVLNFGLDEEFWSDSL
jgi:hypothetical protein